MKIEEIKEAVLIWGILSKKGVDALKKEELGVVAECRPYLYGLKHNSVLLNEERISYFYCTDNMLGYLFREGKIKRTFIFYRRKKEDGFISPAGSLYVFLLSKLHNVELKFFEEGRFLGGVDKDASTFGGRVFVSREDFTFVERPEDELIEYKMGFEEAQNV